MYENVTYNEILNRMMSRVSNKLDKREGSVIWDAHSPAALEIMALYIELERVIRESFGDTASREFLIKRCAERGITPYPASKAVCRGEFTPDNIDVLGKRFNIGEMNFIAVEKISDGAYKMECEQAGSDGNRYLGQLTPIDYVSGLQTAELTELLIPGEDQEDTEELRQRYFDSFEDKAFGGNVKDYVTKTNAIAGVGQTKVTRVWNGDIRPAEMIPSPEVRAWYSAAVNGLAEEPKKWLKTVFKAAEEKKLTVGGTVLLSILGADFGEASAELIAKVQETIDPEYDERLLQQHYIQGRKEPRRVLRGEGVRQNEKNQRAIDDCGSEGPMDSQDTITRGEHEAFSDLMKAENKRLEAENDRQNKRLELLESNMQHIISQQLTTLTATIERLNLSVSNILKEQSEISERLRKLENRDGETWRTVVKYVLTAVVGGIVTFALTRIGM